MEKSKKLYPFIFGKETEIIDENTEITNGFLAENTIDDIIDTYLGDLVGNDNFQYYRGIFPVKITHVHNTGVMTLQTNPNNNTALERYDTFGKAKIWYITKAGRSAKIWLGFNKEMDAGRFYSCCTDGKLEDHLYSFTPKAGDCIYIKPGCVHAAEGAIDFIEISQNSDVTYHLYDLHSKNASKEYKYALEAAEAIDVIDYSAIKSEEYCFENVKGNVTIANVSSFIVKSVCINALENYTAGQYASTSFKMYICLNGEASITACDREFKIAKGETALIPYNIENFNISSASGTPVHLLEISLPDLQEIEEDLYMNYYEDESDYPSGYEEDDDECNCGCEDDEHEHCGHNHSCGCEDDEHEHCGHNHSCGCEDDEHEHCGHNHSCGCEDNEHEHCGHNHSCGCEDDEDNDREHPGERFFGARR